MRISFSAFLITLLCVTTLQAQSNATIVIRGGTLIGIADSKPIKDAVIIIEGTRIKRVGTLSDTKIPPKAQVVDATGKYIIPGLADMHQHLGEGNFDLNQGKTDYQKNLARLLGFGITTVFSFGTPEVETFAELKRVSASEDSPYPHFFGVGVLLRAREGHGSLQGGFTPETAEEARKQVGLLKAAKVDAIKLVHTDLRYVTNKPRPLLKPQVLAAIIDEAHKLGLKAYVHAPVLAHAKEALRAGVDGLVHGVLSDPIDDEFIDLMTRNRATYIPTHSIFEAAGDIGAWAKRVAKFDERGLIPKEVLAVGLNPSNVTRWEEKWNNVAYMKERLPVLRANLKRVWDSGILVVAGSDTGNSGAGTLLGLSSQFELQLMVESGLSAAQVLKSATINAARMTGQEKETGTIEAGKLADLIILDADPIADIRNVRSIYRVIKGGVVKDQATLLGGL